MRFAADAHFLREAVDAEIAAEVFGSGKLGFAGSTIAAPGFRQRKYSQKALHIFRQTPYAGSADLRGPNAHDRARFFDTGFSWEASEYPTSIDLLDVLAMHPGFIMAVAGDYFDRFWQSATPIDYYQTFNRPYEHLSKRQGLFGPEIDISENPGRASIWIERGVTLWAGASLWFGRPSFRYFDETKLTTCPVGTISDVGDLGTLRIDLFDPTTDNEAHIRKIQRTFRDWMGYDTLEEQLPDLESVMASDPQIEILYGTFPSGAKIRYIEYLDNNKQPAVKSRATQAFVVERDNAQKVVSKGFEALST